MSASEPVSRFVSAPDGLRLHYRDYGSPLGAALPIVCLPGLARTVDDFDALARILAADGRRILALDSRGRGLSEHDPDPKNYDLRVETGDVIAWLTAAEIPEAIFVGTSRGGLITLILTALRPTLIRGAVLNDIGPVIEAEGLARIRGYVGKLRQPHSWSEATDMLKQLAGRQFTALSEAEWTAFATTTFIEDNGVFSVRYDPALMNNLKDMDLDDLPTLWPQFEGLKHAPVLVIRGENSDLLSVATVEEMMRRHPDCALHTVPNQGHAPFLTDAPTIGRIQAFVAHCDAARANSPSAQEKASAAPAA